MLEARGLSVEVGGRLTLDGASFSVRHGEKVGLVGRNGAGKTSLLKVLGGEQPAYAGQVVLRGGVGYLRQDPRSRAEPDGTTALSHVLSGRDLEEAMIRLEKLRLAVEEHPSEENVGRYSKAEERFSQAGGYAAESEVRRIVAGLGLTPDRVDLPISVLSGGERRRVELARILFAGSDVLMLDEPTNHLDNDAKSWLISFLRSYRGALLVVSHDLDLLDEAITRVLHLDEAKMVEYKGTYSQYRAARKADEERQAKVATRQAAEIKRLADLADSMRHSTGTRARKAQTLDTRVERLRRDAVTGPARERRYAIKLPQPPHAPRTVVEVAGLAKSYGGPPIFEDVDFAVERGERLLVMGLNGAGKTSLLRVLAGQSEPDRGRVDFGSGVSVGYYAQEHEGIHAGTDVLTHMRQQITTSRAIGLATGPGGSGRAGSRGGPPGVDRPPTEVELRSLLGMFALTGEMAFQDAGTLSGGEKTKLALAQLVVGRHNLLLLDEPTNNLDPASRQAVAGALSSWGGTMIVVSHDAEFVELLEPDRVLMMPEAVLDHWNEELLDLVSMA
ncbi:MAG TPA: ABC-F family ATP-binding cassette domain-containing protein [Acidimicrobiales bacterium]|nr:ABC-F family ATP-binding cassette domain-containing protein [Acidimicrobiales bacterium]